MQTVHTIYLLVHNIMFGQHQKKCVENHSNEQVTIFDMENGIYVIYTFNYFKLCTVRYANEEIVNDFV